jgi:hypothetical protein
MEVPQKTQDGAVFGFTINLISTSKTDPRAPVKGFIVTNGGGSFWWCLDLKERGLSQTAAHLKAKQAARDFNGSFRKNLLRVGTTRPPSEVLRPSSVPIESGLRTMERTGAPNFKLRHD